MIDMQFAEYAQALFKDWEVSKESSLLLQVFDRITLPTFVIDNNHVILHWNRALEALSGFRREEMVGTSGQWKAFYKSARPCLADLIVDGGHDSEIQHYYQDKYRTSELIPDAYEAEDFFPECGNNGEWLHFTAASLFNDDGEVIGAIETLDSITARKKAEFELLERERNYRELSITDALTGLHNSRHFYALLEGALESSRRYNHCFSLCFIDIDNFKALNDTYGHMAGDRVLERFGSLIKSFLRLNDSAYRYGGEEFAIILPSTNIEGAISFANRLLEELGNHRFAVTDNKYVRVTASIGVTEYRVGDDNKAIISRADSALYDAKGDGKNCCRRRI